MIKKFTLIMLFLFMVGIAAFSQTASLANITASPGENKQVALDVTGFSGIGSLTFNIQFDPSVMSFTGITSVASPGGLSAFVSGNTINIAGYWSSNATFANGKLLDLNFTYNGMTTSPLNFLGSCVVTQGVTVIHPTYTNGSVTMAVVPQTATLIPATASTGGNVSVPIQYSNMPGGIGAITQKIHYDPTKLTFINVTGTGTLAVGINQSVNTSTGIITLTWTNLGGTNINWSANKFLLNFVYIGSTVTNIDFVGGCIISTASPVTNVAVSYYGGIVSLAAPSAFASLGSISGALQGQDYEVPLTLSAFPSGISGGTQAFTLTIPYDASKLSYLGLKNPVSGLIVGQASGVLTLAWSDPNGPSINGNFLTLKFKYNGVGTANISFGNGCIFNTNTGGVVNTVQVAYTNATVVPAVVPANATISFVQAAVGANVLVPVTFSSLPTNMGAVTLNISYDYNKLTFVDAQNNTFNANVRVDPFTHIINVAWNASSATDINVKFLDLRFVYNGGGGLQSAAVNFTDGCELANFSGIIVPANWVNGGVNFLFKVSGILAYNSDPNTQIPLEGYTINITTNPGNVLVNSTTTDALGYYEVMVGNGNYFIEPVAPASYNYYSDLDDVVAMFDYTLGTTLPEQNLLRISAGDVNQNGDIDLDDVVNVFQRTLGEILPDYTAPDWVFENGTITVSNANLPSQNLMGLNSGNVLGTNPTP